METYYPKSRTDWRNWLVKNHITEQSVWLVFFKKESEKDSISWSDAVEEALCFGWIDSKKQSIDKYSYRQFYSKRKPNSTWSKINKEKVAYLIEQKLMTQSGIESIEIAKENGSWIILDSVEKLILPNDLEKEFESKPSSKDFFLSLSKSKRKEILAWIVLAKRTETREKRIKEIVELADKNLKPKQFR